MNDFTFRAARSGLLALFTLLGIYFGLLMLVSGRQFTLEQFGLYWPFVVALAIGSGVQVGLYVYLRGLLQGSNAHARSLRFQGRPRRRRWSRAARTISPTCCRSLAPRGW